MEKVFDSILSWEGGTGSRKYLVSPRTVYDFFTQGIHLLRIPDYQRPYSWTKKNINDLLQDVLKLSLKTNPNSSWFLGPIFTVKKSTEDQFSDLLDGQQRITTIQIILREATLITKEEEGINIDQHPILKKQIEIALEACNNCLVRMDGFNKIPVFETEEQLKEIFKTYILEFSDIENYQHLKKRRKEFNDRIKQIKVEGSISAGTILESIATIREFIKQNFINNDKNSIDNLKSFYDFIDALVNKCWLIEIPLQSHNDSIQIFESLNNRGKPLTLVDKLRYKSIISCSNDSISEIRNKWKEVYSGLNFLVDNKFVKTEDDFFKVFFNSIKGDDFTKEDDFITLFETLYLERDKTIISFLNQTITIFSFYKIIQTSLDADNTFIKNYFKTEEHEKVKALIRLLDQAISISDNSRFILFHILVKNPNYHESNYIIIQSIWNLIRYVFHEEVYKSKKSNVIRTEYLAKIKKSNEGSYHFNDSSEILSFDFNKTFNNLIKSTNNSEATFILYFNAYLNEYNSLTTHSPKQYNKSHLDHLFPRAWKSSWKDQKYSTLDVSKFITELQKDSPDLFSNINSEQLLLDIKNSENFELLNYSTSPQRQEESLIEFIGNKWVLHAGTNIKTSNNGFDFKKNSYQDNKWIKIPSNYNEIGINQYEKFTYKEIITRTIKLTNSIVKNFKTNWDDVS
tara:strand:- start:1022 stop:3076 length:2055 start_codon:yes stop_codon:yes gene_type:complete